MSTSKRKASARTTPRKHKSNKIMQARNSSTRYTQLNVLVNVAEHKAITDAAYAQRLTMAEYVRQRVLPSGFTQESTGAKGGSPEPVVRSNDEQTQPIASETAATPAREFVLVGSTDADELRSHAALCLQREGLPCTCGAFEHNARIYGESEDDAEQAQVRTFTFADSEPVLAIEQAEEMQIGAEVQA